MPLDKTNFTLTKLFSKWCVSYDGDFFNGKKAFTVQAETGTVNFAENFKTKREAQAWIDAGCPVGAIEKSIDITHYVWAINLETAIDLATQ